MCDGVFFMFRIRDLQVRYATEVNLEIYRNLSITVTRTGYCPVQLAEKLTFCSDKLAECDESDRVASEAVFIFLV